MVNIGKMNKRIMLQKNERLPDGMGGYKSKWIDVSSVWAQFLAPRFTDNKVQGDSNATVVTQGMRIRRCQVSKDWRVVYGSTVYEILHIDNHSDGETILTTKEVIR